jgi:hypothetical protein
MILSNDSGFLKFFDQNYEREEKQLNLKYFLLLFLFLAILFISLFLTYVILCYYKEFNLDFVSGVWATYASDLLKGLFYRPVFSEIGYGGARYLPLTFIIYAIVLHVFKDPIISVYFYNFLTAVILFSGIYILLRRLNVNNFYILISYILILVSSSFQFAMVSLRPDVLSLSLSIWGFVYILKNEYSNRYIFIASLFFTLAFVTKMTAIAGLVTSIIYLGFRKEIKPALKLIFFSFCGFIITVALILIFSEGRVIEIWQQATILKSHIILLPLALIRLIYVIFMYDPGCLLLFFLGLILILYLNKDIIFKEVVIFFIITLVVTIFIFWHPATSYNHLVDLHISLVILLVSMTAKFQRFFEIKYSLTIIIVLLFLLLQPLWFNIRTVNHYQSHQLKIIKNLVLQKSPGPILSENPWVPILAGQTPFVLDPWGLRVAREYSNKYYYPLLVKMKNKYFKSIVLKNDPQNNYDRNFLMKYHFGEGFIKTLEKYYSRYDKIGEYVIYLPKNQE